MALTLGDNFSYQGAKPLDARLIYSTVASMKAVADATMYDGCMAYCTATDKTYQWKSTNTVDETTGKWREYSGGSSLPSGGTTGQLLAKHSNTDGDVEWVNAPSSIPNGGTTGQALVKHSNTDKDVEWGTVGGLGYEEKILGAQNFTYNDATLVSNGETKVFYSKWNGGSTAGDNAGIPSSPGSVDRYYYIEMTKNTAGTVFVQRCRKFYTQNSTNYVQTYERRCTSSGGTWTYADWIETTAEDGLPSGGTTGQALVKHSATDGDVEWATVSVDTTKLYSTDDTAFTDIADADYIPVYDTSASAKKKSLWSNIKSVLKTYFDTLYQGVLTAGTNIGISGNVISATNTISLNFSTTEQAVGKWIDNKTIYQKTLHVGALGNNTGSSAINQYVAVGANVSSYIDFIPIISMSGTWMGFGTYTYGNVTNSKVSAVYCGGGTNSDTDTSTKNKAGLSYYGNQSWITDSYVTVLYTKV